MFRKRLHYNLQCCRGWQAERRMSNIDVDSQHTVLLSPRGNIMIYLRGVLESVPGRRTVGEQSLGKFLAFRSPFSPNNYRGLRATLFTSCPGTHFAPLYILNSRFIRFAGSPFMRSLFLFLLMLPKKRRNYSCGRRLLGYIEGAKAEAEDLLFRRRFIYN